MRNEDDQCFKWCIARALNDNVKNPGRITTELREQSEELDWRGIVFPVAVDENVYAKIERKKTSISTFTAIRKRMAYIRYIHQSQRTTKSLICCSFPMLKKKHYCWIKDFDKLNANRRKLITMRCIIVNDACTALEHVKRSINTTNTVQSTVLKK